MRAVPKPRTQRVRETWLGVAGDGDDVLVAEHRPEAAEVVRPRDRAPRRGAFSARPADRARACESGCQSGYAHRPAGGAATRPYSGHAPSRLAGELETPFCAGEQLSSSIPELGARVVRARALVAARGRTRGAASSRACGPGTRGLVARTCGSRFAAVCTSATARLPHRAAVGLRVAVAVPREAWFGVLEAQQAQSTAAGSWRRCRRAARCSCCSSRGAGRVAIARVGATCAAISSWRTSCRRTELRRPSSSTRQRASRCLAGGRAAPRALAHERADAAYSSRFSRSAVSGRAEPLLARSKASLVRVRSSARSRGKPHEIGEHEARSGGDRRLRDEVRPTAARDAAARASSTASAADRRLERAPPVLGERRGGGGGISAGLLGRGRVQRRAGPDTGFDGTDDAELAP
jgi:hypothetical protein